MQKGDIKVKKYTYCFVFIVSIAIFITVGIFSYSIYMKNYSIEKWDKHILERENMLQNFIDNYGLIGLSEDEIEYYFGDNGKANGIENAYVIGRGVIDPRILQLYYDDNGIIINYSIYEN